MAEKWSCPSCGSPLQEIVVNQKTTWKQHIGALLFFIPVVVYSQWMIKRDDFTPSSGLRVTHHEARELNGAMHILGAVANEGSKNWKWVKVQVDFYDDKGRFVDQQVERCDWTITAKQTRNFKVDCNGKDGKRAVPPYLKYEIQVVDATAPW